MTKEAVKNTGKAEAPSKRTVEARWGKVNTAAGWTAVPSVLFQRQRALNLSPLDLNIIMYLAGAWWDSDKHPYMSVATIAAAVNVTERTIQRRIKELELWGYVKRHKRSSKAGRNLTNAYDLTGLATACEPYSQERLDDVAQRKREAIARSTRKKPKTLTVIDGGKA